MEDIIEKLANLEHEQWAHWTRYMLDNLTPENIERWKRQIETPYSGLSEDEKDSDREWAQKAMDLVSGHLRDVWNSCLNEVNEAMKDRVI